MDKERKSILAFVGMPGAGKSEATMYLESKGIPFVRFGQLTDEGIREMGLAVNSENERMFREKIRADFGMAAYAIKAEPKINELLQKHDAIVIDGLRSWEEYRFLIKKFPTLKLIALYAMPELRYKRLSERKVRPVTYDESRTRDIAELENLNMGNSIAIADYLIVNDRSLDDLHSAIDDVLKRFSAV